MPVCLSIAFMNRIIWIILILAGVATGQESSLLEQLDRETQAMYQQAQRSVVRVQLPPPAWVEELLAGEHPAAKWRQLDPDVRLKLEQRRPSARQERLNTAILPSTQPADDDGGWQVADSDDDQSVRIESIKRGDRQVIVIAPRAGGGDEPAGVRIEQNQQSGFAPANIAVIVDDQGHVVVPVYLEQRQFDGPAPAQLAGGRSAKASFVGSDRQTGLTVLKLDPPVGAPAVMRDGRRPPTGSLVMTLSPANDTAALMVWTASGREWGVVVSADGAIAGFARRGQFLAGAAAWPVIEQLIAHGTVTRPQLGLVVAEVGPDDPLRERSLGDLPGLRVQRVIPDSPAHRAGMQPDDIILRLGDTSAGDVPTFAAALTGRSGTLPLTIHRDGIEQIIEVSLQGEQADRQE